MVFMMETFLPEGLIVRESSKNHVRLSVRRSCVRTVLEHENGAVKGICSKNRVPRDKSVTNLELTGFGGSDSNPASGDVTENQCDAERPGSPSGDPCSAGPIYLF